MMSILLPGPTDWHRSSILLAGPTNWHRSGEQLSGPDQGSANDEVAPKQPSSNHCLSGATDWYRSGMMSLLLPGPTDWHRSGEQLTGPDQGSANDKVAQSQPSSNHCLSGATDWHRSGMMSILLAGPTDWHRSGEQLTGPDQASANDDVAQAQHLSKHCCSSATDWHGSGMMSILLASPTDWLPRTGTDLG